MINKIPRTYFLHIPKTSGTSTYTSVFSLLDKSKYNEWLTWHHIALQSNRENLIRDLYSDKYLFVTGHFGWNTKIIRNRFVFSMFRNPIYRTISQLQHIKKFPLGNAWVDEGFVINENDLLSQLYNPDLVKFVSNVQTKYLLSDFDPSEEILHLTKNKNYFFDQDDRLLNTINRPKYWITLKIIQKLLRLDFFGLNMLHPESMILLSSKLGVVFPEIEIHKMVSNFPSESYPLKPETLVLLESINIYDSILYDIAKRLFIKRWMKFFNEKTGRKIKFDEYIRKRKEYLETITKTL
ncbi:MAG TPA: hypothetical protein VHA74_01945 [Candidatus Dojkabacteria bacterium]|nr:hypothetical protein [Candidatus Dojkabacteria bacterium]